MAPPVETMAVNYLTPLMTPIPVATRLPRPDNDKEVINGYLQVEAGGGVLTHDSLLWDMSVVLHGYSRNEVEAEDIITKAVAWAGNIQGTMTTVLDRDWYVTFSRVASLPIKQQDPRINLTRYRAMVTWRIPGQAL